MKGARSFLKLWRGGRARADIPLMSGMPSWRLLEGLHKWKCRLEPRRVKIDLAHPNRTSVEVFLLLCLLSCSCAISQVSPRSDAPSRVGCILRKVGKQVGKGMEKTMAEAAAFTKSFSGNISPAHRNHLPRSQTQDTALQRNSSGCPLFHFPPADSTRALGDQRRADTHSHASAKEVQPLSQKSTSHKCHLKNVRV